MQNLGGILSKSIEADPIDPTAPSDVSGGLPRFTEVLDTLKPLDYSPISIDLLLDSIRKSSKFV